MPFAGTKTPNVLNSRVQVKYFEYSFRFECKTATASARARTRAANTYTKRDIENSFPGTQMSMQARNKKNVFNAIQTLKSPKNHLDMTASPVELSKKEIT